MKVFAIQITLNGNPESIFIKTNADASKVKNFTIIDVIKPNGIGDLPIRAGLVMNYSELLDKIALSDAMGLISVSAVKVQDGDIPMLLQVNYLLLKQLLFLLAILGRF